MRKEISANSPKWAHGGWKIDFEDVAKLCTRCFPTYLRIHNPLLSWNPRCGAALFTKVSHAKVLDNSRTIPNLELYFFFFLRWKGKELSPLNNEQTSNWIMSGKWKCSGRNFSRFWVLYFLLPFRVPILCKILKWNGWKSAKNIARVCRLKRRCRRLFVRHRRINRHAFVSTICIHFGSRLFSQSVLDAFQNTVHLYVVLLIAFLILFTRLESSLIWSSLNEFGIWVCLVFKETYSFEGRSKLENVLKAVSGHYAENLG